MNQKPHFKALLTFLSAREGKQTTPISSGHRVRIQLPLEREQILASLNFIEEELVFPGDSLNAYVTLIASSDVSEKIYKGLDFDFYENENVIGQGTVIQAGGFEDYEDLQF